MPWRSFHLIAHGLFKGTIFLNCGRVIHDANKEQKSPYEHGEHQKQKPLYEEETEEGLGFSRMTWIIGFLTTLTIPLIILLTAHGILKIPLTDSQGVVIFFAIAIMLPLFPFHGVYVTALSRLPGVLPVFPAFILPIAGLYGAMVLLPKMSVVMLKGVSVLALCGAVYGSLKAVIQYKVTNKSAYMGVALYSILWWYLANTGTYTPQAVAYAGALSGLHTGELV